MSKYHQLSQQDRYTITALLRRRLSQRAIAAEMGRAVSSISRELARNARRYVGGYCAEKAQSYTNARRRISRQGGQFSPAQWRTVIDYIKTDYSPEQIAAHFKIHGPFGISHETIYQFIIKDKKAGGTLYKHLRIMPKIRRKRYNTKDSRGILPGKRHISERPSEVDLRQTLGHWEADTVMGTDGHHCILTLVERKSGYTIIRKLNHRTVSEVTIAAIIAIGTHGRRIKTITFDNGTEFHGYQMLETVFRLRCYFATPYHSWERGSNENLNGLIRQYIPKGTCMKPITQEYCDWIAERLNTRPRKRHGFKSPKEVYYGKR